MLLEIDIWLSFKIKITLLLIEPRWFKASKDSPPTIAPSPTTGTMLKLSLFKSLAIAIATAAERAVEEWPASQTSCLLSQRFWKPDNPWYFRKVLNWLARPVRILWT